MNSGPTRNRRIRCVNQDACSYPERSTRPMIAQKLRRRCLLRLKRGIRIQLCHQSRLVENTAAKAKSATRLFPTNECGFPENSHLTTEGYSIESFYANPSWRIACIQVAAVGLGLALGLRTGTGDFRRLSTKSPAFLGLTARTGSANSCELRSRNLQNCLGSIFQICDYS